MFAVLLGNSGVAVAPVEHEPISQRLTDSLSEEMAQQFGMKRTLAPQVHRLSLIIILNVTIMEQKLAAECGQGLAG